MIDNLTELIDNFEVDKVIPEKVIKLAQKERLIIALPHHDDTTNLIRFEGLFEDVGNNECLISYDGLVERPDQSDYNIFGDEIEGEKYDQDFQNYLSRKKRSIKLELLYDEITDAPIDIKTDIPHNKFKVLMDREHLGFGLVISADLIKMNKSKVQ